MVEVVDIAPTLVVRVLQESGIPYNLYWVDLTRKPELEEIEIPISGTFDELLEQVDAALDATRGGIGAFPFRPRTAGG